MRIVGQEIEKRSERDDAIRRRVILIHLNSLHSKAQFQTVSAFGEKDVVIALKGVVPIVKLFCLVQACLDSGYAGHLDLRVVGSRAFP